MVHHTYFASELKVSKFMSLGGLSNAHWRCCLIGWAGLDGSKSRFFVHRLRSQISILDQSKIQPRFRYH